ncbi:MAG TPA: hypothetical protein VFV64_00935 [Permianibacter sp.]|nr:hypothetical protein [Permianibacter sp.]
MNRFRRPFSPFINLRLPLRRLLLGAGLCSVVLAGDSVPGSAPMSDRPDDGDSSLHIELSVSHRPAVSYALIREHDTTVFVGASPELRQVNRLQKKRAGEYLWIRQGDNEYVLDDATAIAELRLRWQALKAPEQQMAALEDQLEPYTEQLEAQADELQAATEQWGGGVDHQRVDKLHEKMQALHEKIEPISDQMQTLGETIETLADDAHRFTLQRIEAAVQGGLVKPVPRS